MGALDTPAAPPVASIRPSSQHSLPSLPPSLPPARPCRPKPPPPALKSSQLPSGPPLPPSTPPALPPPLPPISKSPLPLSSNPTHASLPPPLSPTLVTPSPPHTLHPIDRLLGSTSVWQPKGLSQDQTMSIMERATAGTFLVHSKEDKGPILSVRLPDDQGVPLTHNLLIKQHNTCMYGSFLVFDDIFKLISFYCASRYMLFYPCTHLHIHACVADFWSSDLHQQAKDQDRALELDHSTIYLYVKAVPVEETPNKYLNPNCNSKLDAITNQSISSCQQNGETPQKVSAEVKGPTKATPNQENKYKRPPPRPPSLGSGSGMGLLFSSPPLPHTSCLVIPAAKKKEEGRGGVGEREERSVPISPPPSKPPVPTQSRAAPPLPPAPLSRTSSRKSSDRELGEGREREKGQISAKNRERKGGGEVKTGCKSVLLGEAVDQENSSHLQEEETKKEAEKRVKEDEQQDKDVKMDREEDKEKSCSQCQPLAKKPSRPVPPPRRKPCSPDSPARSTQPAGGTAGIRGPPPSPARRPDVSLYSPQGGTVIGNDPDSCSNSSTEEEGDLNQEQEKNPKTSTTVMLDRARYRLSAVLTSLISHDRRLTQRIVELARDPLNYFGNLVSEHRAFTLETMSNHSSSTELLQEIRQMLTQLKSYLLQSTELQAMLEPQHQYAQDKLESMVEAALCKSVLKPLRENIYLSLERLHTINGSLKQLAENQSVVLGSTTTALGITTAVPEASAMEKISIKLNSLHLEYSPQRKIELLLKTCKIIYDSMSVSSPGRTHGADDFLPVMMYVLARSNLSNLQLDVEYMMELMDPSLALGEGSYYLTTTYGALEHIKSFDQQRSATRQLSREVQDSIHRWERRRTLNQERMAQTSIRVHTLEVCCCHGTWVMSYLFDFFLTDSYVLSVYMNGVHRPLGPAELAVSVKDSCQHGAYCFVFHPKDQPNNQRGRSCPTDPPPAPPAQSFYPAEIEAVDSVEPETEEDILITL
uniref:VPS9 domain-containing protein n=1 Tax=Mola mola TaxID=94237 RepID=A0A3Q3W3Y3_MOLML